MLRTIDIAGHSYGLIRNGAIRNMLNIKLFCPSFGRVSKSFLKFPARARLINKKESI